MIVAALGSSILIYFLTLGFLEIQVSIKQSVGSMNFKNGAFQLLGAVSGLIPLALFE